MLTANETVFKMAAKSILKWASSCPMVVIFGATGTGKSKLAIEIAKRFGGEIISVDSMQVYLGLDIITNKVTKDEQSNIPHHLMNYVDPYIGITVVDFRNKALQVIEDVNNRGKLPILVGGTMYYLESILFDFLLPDPNLKYSEDNPAFAYDAGFSAGDDGGEGGEGSSVSKRPKMSLENLPVEDLYKRAVEVDPEIKSIIHPKNKRKILRCLEVFENTGKKMSVALKAQKAVAGASRYGGPIRFPRAILLWLKCDMSVLTERLEQRVDKMMEDGLVQELLDFHNAYNKMRLEKNEVPDYTRGIFQAIGFKEFHEYLVMEEEERKSKAGEKLLINSTKLLKQINRRYAKTQLRWIQYRFLGRGHGQMPPIYELDATDVSLWNEKVFAVAEDVVDSVINGRTPLLEPLRVTARSKDTTIHECSICDRYFQGAEQLEDHLKSKKHSKQLAAKIAEVNRETETETEAGTEAGTETGTESGAEPGAEPGAEADADADPIISDISNNIPREIKPENT